MKTRLLLAGNVALMLLATPALPAAAQTIRLDAKPGQAKVRIEGTSTIHDWQAEGTVIGGHVEAGPGFPIEPGQEVKPGKVDARVEAFIPVRSVHSVKPNGTPYDDKMDETMWEKLNQLTHPRIYFYLSELTLKEAPKTKDLPYTFDAKGELVVGGVTNKISMPVNVTPVGGKVVKITGSTAAKMSDFAIPAEKIGLGFVSFKTADGVKLFFEWTVYQKVPAGAAPAK